MDAVNLNDDMATLANMTDENSSDYDDGRVPLPHQVYPRASRSFRSYDRQHEHHRRILLRVGIAVALVGASLAVGGGIEFGMAESERLHGWKYSVCDIVTNHGLNDTSAAAMCVYLTVEHHGRNVCAVPATVAREVWFHEAPACMSLLSPVDRHELERWRAVESTQVRCLVPDDPVPAEKCVQSATSQSFGAAAWRSYVERFVYLIDTAQDGSDAVTNVTAARRGAALAFILAGLGLLIVGLVSIFFTQWLSFCRYMARAAPSLTRNYRERRVREHHLH
jgi:hypothetical protein